MEKENAVVYARYSSHNQREQSIEDQIAACRKYADENGLEIIGIYADYAQSGRTDKRSEFQRMLRDMENHEFENILIWKTDRFGRNRQEMALNKLKLQENGVKLIPVMENIPETPEGVIVEGLMESLAEYYSLNLAQNVKRGHHSNAEKALSNGGVLPEGLKVENKRYTIDEERAPIVRTIFDKFLNGYSITEIAKSLKKDGIRNKNENYFSNNGIESILKNRKYIGEYRYDGTVIPDAIPAIISESDFMRAQERLQGKKDTRKTKDEDGFLLTGKLVCSRCGSYYTSDAGTSKTGKVHKYYKCKSKKLRLKECDSKTLRKDDIEQCVIEKTLNEVLTDRIIYNVAELMNEDIVHDNTIVPILEKEIKSNDRKTMNLIKSLEDTGQNELIVERIHELQLRNEDIKKRLSIEKMHSQVPNEDAIVWFLNNIKNDTFQDNTYFEIMIRKLINEILVTNKGILISYNVSDDVILNESSNNFGMVNLPDIYLNFNQLKAHFYKNPTTPKIINNHFYMNFNVGFIQKLYR